MIQCEHCGGQMRENVPGVDTREAPFYTAVVPDGDRVTTLYFCTDNCIQSHLKYR